MATAIVDGTLVREIREGFVRVRVDRLGVSELYPGSAVALKLEGDVDRYLGTIVAVLDDHHITVLLDRVAMTEQLVAQDPRRTPPETPRGPDSYAG